MVGLCFMCCDNEQVDIFHNSKQPEARVKSYSDAHREVS
jgi:hypothetical protein